MPLDPQAKAFLEKRVGVPSLHLLSVEEARKLAESRGSMFGEMDPIAQIENRTIPGSESPLPIRVYRPEGTPPFPMLVFFHGGGWMVGSLEGHDSTCRALSNRSGALVVQVDFRRAPEFKFPAAVDDAWAAIQWLARHGAELGGDPTRLAVGGDGSGGNLAIVSCVRARDREGPPICFQLLVYPVTDYDFSSPSMIANGEGYNLTRETMHWYWSHYLPNEEAATNPEASPLRTPTLEGMPPAHIITVEYDPLRDQSERYAERLRQSGVKVTWTRYPGQIHGFFRLPNIIDDGRDALNEAAAALRLAFQTAENRRAARTHPKPS